MKNIFIGGIQGMGKSTLVNSVFKAVPELHVCREGDYSPVDLAWCTWMSKEEYEVEATPSGTLLTKRESEIRIMCPKDTQWFKQSSGENADPNSYYIGLKIYAPSKDIYGFKEEIIEVQLYEESYFRRFVIYWWYHYVFHWYIRFC